MPRRTVPLACLALAWVAPASGDTGLSFEVSNTIGPNKPGATIEVWAFFEGQSYAFAAAKFDVSATHDQGDFSDPFAVLHTLGTFDGDVQPDGDSVTHCLPGQIQAPLGQWFAETANPILIWQATWSTSDFTPRTIDLATITKTYAIYLDYDGNNILVDDVLEGAGSIIVVPAPGGLGPLAIFGCVCAASRRRARN